LNVFDEVFVGVFERLDLSAQGYRSWVGALEGMPYSHVVLTEGDGVVSGQFTTPADVYQVQTIAPGVHHVRQVIASGRMESDERILDLPAETPTAPSLARPGTDDGSQIDVLLPRSAERPRCTRMPGRSRARPTRRSSSAA
jgi:hypothetical protein